MALISLSYHLIFVHDFRKIDPEILLQYYQALIFYWTEHYQKFKFYSGNTVRVMVSAGLSFWALERLAKKRGHLKLTYNIFIASIFTAGIFSVVYWLPPEKAQWYYQALRLYPARLFNLTILGSILLLLSFWHQHKLKPFAQVNLLALIFAPLLYRYFYLRYDHLFYFPFSIARFMGLVMFASFLVLVWSSKNSSEARKINNILRQLKPFPDFYRLMVKLGLVLIFLLTFNRAYLVWQKNQTDYFIDSANSLFYQFLNKREGMIIPGTGVNWLMHKTRRPVLYNGGPATLTYVPEAGPSLNNIFQKVYGVDYLNPPPEVVETGRNLPASFVKELWEKRSLGEWQKIKKEFKAADIVVKSDWQLNLPLISTGHGLALYFIPN